MRIIVIIMYLLNLRLIEEVKLEYLNSIRSIYLKELIFSTITHNLILIKEYEHVIWQIIVQMLIDTMNYEQK